VNPSPFVRTINRIHLIYLGLLPSAATFVLLRRHGHPLPFLLFVGGVATTGVYLVTVYSYTRLPHAGLASLWALLDGPLFALTARGWRGAFPSVFIESFLIDGLALWLAILTLTFLSSRPLPTQRIASAGIGCAVVALMFSLFWPHVLDVLWHRWARLAWIAGGIVEGALVRYRLLKAGLPVRLNDDEGILFGALLVMAWVAAMSAGIAIHNAS